MIYLGIDVGGKGGLFAMNDSGKILLKEAIPTKKGGNEVCYETLVRYIREVDKQNEGVKTIIEDVHSLYGMSAKSNFNFGLIKGIKMGVFEALYLPYELVTPKNWQKVIWIEDDIVKKAGKKDTKATSLNAALRIFPNVDFRKSNRARIPHDGIVDAALMAEYAKRKHNEQ